MGLGSQLITQATTARNQYALGQKEQEQEGLKLAFKKADMERMAQEQKLKDAVAQAQAGHLRAQTSALLAPKPKTPEHITDQNGDLWVKHDDGSFERAKLRGTEAPSAASVPMSAPPSASGDIDLDQPQTPVERGSIPSLPQVSSQTPKFGAKPPVEPLEVTVDPRTKQRTYTPRSRAAGMQAPEPPAPQQSFTPVTLGGGDGAPPVVVPFNTKEGTAGKPIGDAKPSASMAKLTEPQEKSYLFYKLMENAQPQIDTAMKSGAVRKAAVSAYLATPGVLLPLANAGLNAKEQSLIRSFKDFAAGVLRKESGAAVTDSELREVWARFGPGFGDEPTLDTEKSKARIDYMTTMKQQAGPAIQFYDSHAKGAGVTDDQKDWDAAVKLYGKDRVLKEYGPRP